MPSADAGTLVIDLGELVNVFVFNQLVKDGFCQALGLDADKHRVVNANITICPDEALAVDVRMVLTNQQLRGLGELFVRSAGA
jgi:hypothetical protein